MSGYRWEEEINDKERRKGREDVTGWKRREKKGHNCKVKKERKKLLEREVSNFCNIKLRVLEKRTERT